MLYGARSRRRRVVFNQQTEQIYNLPHQNFPVFVIPFIYNEQENVKCAWQRQIGDKTPYWEKHWLVYGKDYTVNPLTEQDTGGTLTMLHTLPAEAQQFVIRRVTPKTQTVDLNDNTRLRAELIEAIGDKTTMAIQEIFQQNIDNDNLEEIKREINEAIEIEQQEIEALVAQQIAREADTRRKADNEETAARETGDNTLGQHLQIEAALRATGDDAEAETRAAADRDLRDRIDEVAIQEDVNRYDLESLLQLVLSKLGPFDSIVLTTESRDILITEAGTRLVT
jgi:hypothetical protein